MTIITFPLAGWITIGHVTEVEERTVTLDNLEPYRQMGSLIQG